MSLVVRQQTNIMKEGIIMAFDKETGTKGIRQYHIGMVEGDIGEYVLLPGDPFRTDLMAKFLDDAKLVQHKREHKTYTGYYKGIKVSITSTGMGCPSTAIALEELANIGGKVFIRLGTSAALKEGIHPGDILITTASMKNDGTTKMYVPERFPAVADLDLTYTMIKEAKQQCENSSRAVFSGITATDDAFYAETPEWMEELARLGCTNIEMESSAIFTICHKRNLRGACICACVSNHITSENFFGKENTGANEAIEKVTNIALETFYQFDKQRRENQLVNMNI